jgi:hypothetical protein
MWLVRRLFSTRRRSPAPPRGGLDAARAYGRWLDDALNRLAETLLWATRLAPKGTWRGLDEAAHYQVHVHDARQSLVQLLQSARQREPAAALGVVNAASAHLEYIALLERSVVAMDGLGQGLASIDEDAVRLASAELHDVSVAAARLHARVIEWALPLLLGPD